MRVIESISSALSLSPDIAKTLICLLLSVLLSPIYRVISRKTVKKAVSILLGTLLLLIMLQQWSIFILCGIVIPFYVMRITDRPLFVSAVCSVMLLLIVHGHRFMFAYSEWKVDCSVYVMLLVTKLTYYGKYQQDSKLKAYSLTDFLAYNLFFPSVLVGPTFAFSTFQDFLEGKMSIDKERDSWGKILRPFVLAVPIAVVTLYCMPLFGPEWVLTNEFYLGLPFWIKILALNPIGFIYRSKYYAAWFIGQGCVNLSGLSWKEGQYNGVKAVSLEFEFQENPKLKTEHWNSSMQEWLKNVVYESLAKRAGASWGLFLTFLVSAFWHGLYLTYYIGFLSWAVLLHLTKWVYKWTRIVPVKVRQSLWSRIGVWVISNTLMSFIGMFMLILQSQKAMSFARDIKYYAFIVLFGLLGVSAVVRPPNPKKKE